ncbi:SRPBCC family protein [Candidatus Acetothermia bacterium]|nr:SRPBCC family protein [Candidatus Acetothermia bacterium]MBI3644172.1 SRPBCC family protein [Candidatus Acetothermia bacterium]
MKRFHLHMEQRLPASASEIFRFFSDAHNLETLTPRWLGFRVLTPSPIVLQKGAVIDYRLKLHGIPLRWQSEITAWEPPYRFVDEQRKGPYRLWIHTHTFESQKGGTLTRDDVEYAVHGGSLIQRWFVQPDLRRLFAHRQQQLTKIFGNPPIP